MMIAPKVKKKIREIVEGLRGYSPDLTRSLPIHLYDYKKMTLIAFASLFMKNKSTTVKRFT